MYASKSAVHPVYMTKRVTPRFKQTAKYRLTFIRQWRKKAGMSLEQLADRVETTHASLSRIERGMQPYNQELLEHIAVELKTDVASLLMRDPSEPGIWSLWDQARPGQRQMIVDIAETVLKTGT